MDEDPVFLLAAVTVTHQHPQLVSRPEMRPSACWVFFRILKKSLMKIIEQSLVSWVPRQAATINWLFYLSFSRELLRKNLGSSSAGIELCWCWGPVIFPITILRTERWTMPDLRPQSTTTCLVPTDLCSTPTLLSHSAIFTSPVQLMHVVYIILNLWMVIDGNRPGL